MNRLTPSSKLTVGVNLSVNVTVDLCLFVVQYSLQGRNSVLDKWKKTEGWIDGEIMYCAKVQHQFCGTTQWVWMFWLSVYIVLSALRVYTVYLAVSSHALRANVKFSLKLTWILYEGSSMVWEDLSVWPKTFQQFARKNFTVSKVVHQVKDGDAE